MPSRELSSALMHVDDANPKAAQHMAKTKQGMWPETLSVSSGLAFALGSCFSLVDMLLTCAPLGYVLRVNGSCNRFPRWRGGCSANG